MHNARNNTTNRNSVCETLSGHRRCLPPRIFGGVRSEGVLRGIDDFGRYSDKQNLKVALTAYAHEWLSLHLQCTAQNLLWSANGDFLFYLHLRFKWM